MSNNIYLETTAVIDAIHENNSGIKNILHSSDKRYSSQYVKMEIKRGYLNNIILLYNKIATVNEWSETQEYISKLSSTPLRNQLGTILNALSRFWKTIEEYRPSDLRKKYGDIPISSILKSQSLSFLRTWITLIIRKFDKIVNENLNPMNCFADLMMPIKRDNLFDNKPVICSGSNIECEIKLFFDHNSSSFYKIHAYLKSLPDDQKDVETLKRISSLKKILKLILSGTRYFSNHRQNEKLCWNCGDAIHAVIAPAGCDIVNRNDKHFSPICQAINKVSRSY